jgi:alanine dehydrogenase
MSKVLFINEDKIKKILTEKKAFELADETFKLIAQKRTQMPPKIYLDVPGNIKNDFRAMPAYFSGKKSSACGIKWVSVYPDNRKMGLPTVNATILLSSAVTGMLLAVLEANVITAMRTGAAAAVASHYMANPKPKKLAIVGAGLQAWYQLRALADLYSFNEISIWGFQENEAKRFVGAHVKQFKNLRPVDDIKECVKDADIIVTCTSSRKPLVRAEWIQKGAHINAIGADAKGKQELDAKILKVSKVVVDEWEQASHSGEINVPISKKLFSKKNLCGELSDIVSAKKKGRTHTSDITVFDSTGLAVLDIVFAMHIYKQV